MHIPVDARRNREEQSGPCQCCPERKPQRVEVHLVGRILGEQEQNRVAREQNRMEDPAMWPEASHGSARREQHGDMGPGVVGADARPLGCGTGDPRCRDTPLMARWAIEVERCQCRIWCHTRPGCPTCSCPVRSHGRADVPGAADIPREPGLDGRLARTLSVGRTELSIKSGRAHGSCRISSIFRRRDPQPVRLSAVNAIQAMTSRTAITAVRMPILRRSRST